MLEALFVTPAAVAIGEALGSAKADGPLAIVGNAKLAKLLGAAREVIPVGLSPRAAKKLPKAIADLTGVPAASLAAVIGVDLATDDSWQDTLRSWSRVVRDGGAIVFVDRGHSHEASRRALCGGLSEIEQRHAGRAVITSGLVSHLAAPA
jgi:alkylated DNA nucleotide flippase Atl1